MLRIGMVCPYSLTIPGGVQQQVLDLARAMRAKGHEVRVLGPCDGPPPEPFVTPIGNSLPTAVNGSVYGNYQYQDLMQAYNDLAAEGEFAWYVGVVPPIQTLTLNDLAHADTLHPNTYGQAKVAQAVGQYLSAMLGNFVISTPYPRPYGAGSTAGLGNRIGYY